MDDDKRLLRFEFEGAHIEQCVGGWRTTIIRHHDDGTEGRESCPLRVNQELAFDDAEAAIPGVLTYGIVRVFSQTPEKER